MGVATMYDSTDPSAIPRSASYLAVYANGRYAADLTTVHQEYPNARVFTIDVLNTDPAGCGILDVETGDATSGDVPGWVEARLKAHPGVLCRVYCNKSTWPAVKAAVAGLSSADRGQVRYWIADPTGQPHLVPGSDATQYAWGASFDTSVIVTSPSSAFVGS